MEFSTLCSTYSSKLFSLTFIIVTCSISGCLRFGENWPCVATCCMRTTIGTAVSPARTVLPLVVSAHHDGCLSFLTVAFCHQCYFSINASLKGLKPARSLIMHHCLTSFLVAPKSWTLQLVFELKCYQLYREKLQRLKILQWFTMKSLVDFILVLLLL